MSASTMPLLRGPLAQTSHRHQQPRTQLVAENFVPLTTGQPACSE